MHWLNLPRVDVDEMIDAPDQPLADMDASMSDLARINALFGGTRAVIAETARILRTTGPAQSTVRILDIGAGSGDIPRALAAWARVAGVDISIVAVDNLENMLRIASAKTQEANIAYLQADALALPFAPASFDIATCNLMFHHLGLERSARVLAEMDRLSTRGFVATDLRRDRLSLALVSAGIALVVAHPFTRHDGPASVRRAFTPREYEKIIALSGVQGVRMTSTWYSRMVLVKSKA